MGVAGSMLKMVKGPIQEVIGRIMQQINVIEEIQQGIASEAAGAAGIWVGEDADAFIAEVQSRLIPQIIALLAAIGSFPGGLNNAMDIVSQADSRISF